ncbi:MAG: hypothetical protein ACYSUI_14395 [Planctomycetota bacterium]|jgi:hypothetical protein
MIGETVNSEADLEALLAIVGALLGLGLVFSQFLRKVVWVDRAQRVVLNKRLTARIRGEGDVRAIEGAVSRVVQGLARDVEERDDVVLECRISIRVSDALGAEPESEGGRIASEAKRHFYDLFVWAGIIGRLLEALLVLSVIVIVFGLVSWRFLFRELGVWLMLGGAVCAVVSVVASELIKAKRFPEVWQRSS